MKFKDFIKNLYSSMQSKQLLKLDRRSGLERRRLRIPVVQERRRRLERRKQLGFKPMKDSWIHRLRLAEAKRIRHISVKLAAIASVIILLGSIIGIYFNILDKFFSTIVIGIGVATSFWLLVSYGDHKLRKIRIKKDWYGNNAMEVYELIQFIKKNGERQ